MVSSSAKPEPHSRYVAVPLDERGVRTSRAIAEAALVAFRDHGYAATTIEHVAMLATVSPRSVYRHFGNKSALYAATIALGMSDFLEHLATQVEGAPLRTAILTAFDRTTVDATEEIRQMINLAATEEDVTRYWLVASQRMRPKLAAILRVAGGQAHEDGDFQWDVRAASLLAALNLAYQRWGAIPGSELVNLVADAVDTVLPALHPSVAVAEDHG